MKLENKVAVITGASRGLGLATAKLFFQEGATVVCVGRTDCNPREFAVLHFGGSERAFYQRADISLSEEVHQLARFIGRSFGRLNVLVNNAAIDTIGTVETTSEEDFLRVVRVNVFGTFLVTKHLMPLLKKGGSGSTIVNVASCIGMMGRGERVAYTTSKAAVVNFTRSVAIDCAPLNILVNAIAPGAILTEMGQEFFAKHASEKFRRKVKGWHALERFSEPSEIAKGILFLACDDSSYCTGSVLAIDGGYTIGKW
jgi:meso-butanediol dehydrogenase/(S,S)-butanediol dehydrogenase/diacetyl reductase